MRIFVLLLYLCSVTVYSKFDASDSVVLVDWHNLIPSGAVCRHFQLDYYPPVGYPPSHSLFAPKVLNVTIHNTTSATEYFVNITALIEPGFKSLLLSNLYISSPSKPKLEYLRPDEDGVTFAILYPRTQGISYYVEYNAAGDIDQASYVETNQTALRIKGLSPNTVYELRIYAIFRGTPSTEPLAIDFKTKEIPARSNENKHRRPVKPFQYTQPPNSPITQPPHQPCEEQYRPQINNQSYLPSHYQQPSPINGYQSFNQLTHNTPLYYYVNATTVPSMEFNRSSNTWQNMQESYTGPQMSGAVVYPDGSGLISSNFETKPNIGESVPDVQIFPKTSEQAETMQQSNGYATLPNRWPDASFSLSETPTIPPTSENTDNVSINDSTFFPVYATAYVETTTMGIPTELTVFVTEATMTTVTPITDEIHLEPVTETTTIGVNVIDDSVIKVSNDEFVENTTPRTTSPKALLIIDDPEDLGYISPNNNKVVEKENKEVIIANEDMNLEQGNTKNETEDLANTTEHIPSELVLDERDKITVTREYQKMKLEWRIPETVFCDSYLVNTTVLTLKTPKSFSVVSSGTNSSIKMYNGHLVLIKVSCMLENAISNVWSAQTYVDFRKPNPVKGLYVRDVTTDEFYVASIILEIDEVWQESDKYDIVISWGLGKKVIANNKLVFNGQYIFNVSNLEPARLYTFSVRNCSRDTKVESSPIGIRQITAPIITSTVYPGQISSYAININYDETASEHLFESYELVFLGNSKNITKKLSKKDPKTFTFNKLIPGKTYSFILYTVYKNVRSRPVSQDITTYPLKARKFYAMVGPGYATLAWEVENVANNECQFRLEYASTSNSGIQKSQKVKLQDVNMYRFTGLQFETYYTFTITVLMGKGDAVAESESEMITVGFKSRPTSFPTLKRQGSREMLLTFENDPRLFADTNGVVDNFAVIVTQDPELGGDNYELKSYYDIKDEDVWPAYRASHSNYHPFKRHGSSRVASFVIGEEDCDRRKLNETYCNGVLRSHVDYYVKVRAYLVTNIAMETEWVSVKGLVDETPHEKGQRRLPCYMYLNGCSKSDSNSNLINFTHGSLLFISLLIVILL